MAGENKNVNGPEPDATDLQLSEGKSLSFLATNLSGEIELGGLPPANVPSEGSANDAPPPERSSDVPVAAETAPPDAE